jgi:hypothetical protein
MPVEVDGHAYLKAGVSERRQRERELLGLTAHPLHVVDDSGAVCTSTCSPN